MSYVTGAHNMKFGYFGGFINPSHRFYYYNEIIAYRFNNGVPNQLTESRPLPGHDRVRTEPRADLLLCAGSVDLRQADAAGRRAVRPLLTSYPEARVGGTRLMPTEIVYPVPVDARDRLERHHAPDGRGLRPVRERQDGRQVQPGQVCGSLCRRRTATTWTSVPSLALPSPRRGRGPTRTKISCRTAISRIREERRMRGRWRTRISGRTSSPGPSTPTWSPAGATALTTGRWACRSSRSSSPVSR